MENGEWRIKNGEWRMWNFAYRLFPAFYWQDASSTGGMLMPLHFKISFYFIYKPTPSPLSIIIIKR